MTLTQQEIDYLCGRWNVQPEAIDLLADGSVNITVTDTASETDEVIFAGWLEDVERYAAMEAEKEALRQDADYRFWSGESVGL